MAALATCVLASPLVNRQICNDARTTILCCQSLASPKSAAIAIEQFLAVDAAISPMGGSTPGAAGQAALKTVQTLSDNTNIGVFCSDGPTAYQKCKVNNRQEPYCCASRIFVVGLGVDCVKA
ncbi:hypothetical protein LTS10_006916 [Elasticomyces elasticus]|nr:hypothetical protein LTS10_006916 [Elasticomyces elasticus]